MQASRTGSYTLTAEKSLKTTHTICRRPVKVAMVDVRNGEQFRHHCVGLDIMLARFTVELQTRRDVLSFSRGEKVAGTAG